MNLRAFPTLSTNEIGETSCIGDARFETMGGALEEVPCLLCKSTPWTDYDTENGYRLVKCSDCGLLFTNPRPSSSEIDAASKSGMHKGDEELEVSGVFRPFMKEIYLSVLNDFQYPAKLHPTPPLIGWTSAVDTEICGSPEHRWRRSYRCHRAGAQRTQTSSGEGAEGMDLVFFDTTEHDQTYDVISALNVFSHLPDPRGHSPVGFDA